MGLLPHQIRGYLTHYNNLVLTGHAYSKCTACSATVLDAYARDGYAFLRQVFNNPSFLEDLTGLTALHKEAEDGLADWDVDEEENGAGDADAAGGRSSTGGQGDGRGTADDF
jgi:ubiquitin-like modifier-activating enzyme ATG7